MCKFPSIGGAKRLPVKKIATNACKLGKKYKHSYLELKFQFLISDVKDTSRHLRNTTQ